MASIVRKTIRGRNYFYARECRRVDGKPKIVRQRYLGRADDIIAAVEARNANGQPLHACVREFAASAALFDIARRLRVVELIDRHVPKHRGPSVGTYMLVAAINRAVDPKSKVKIGEWFDKTVLGRLIDIHSHQLTSQRFWDNMDRVTPEAINAIERDLLAHMVVEFGLDLRQVLFDGTNFFTFIDSFNERCTVAQRGKSKEGRAGLRIVGVALLVTTDFHVPLCHRTYPGNQSDAPMFKSLTEELVARHQLVAEGVERVTLVFDKGNNSSDNLQAVADSPYHFVGSLVPTQHPDLLKIPLRRFQSLDADGYPKVRCYRTRKEVFGVERTVLVTHNEALLEAQSKTLLREIAKRQRYLDELQMSLRRWHKGKRPGKPPTMAGTRKKVDGWLSARHMKELFTVTITEHGGLPKLHYRFGHRAWQRLRRTLLGKNLLFTDNDDWTDAEIVRAYRNQHHVETAFRDMKDPQHLSLRPQRHWTDQKIAVHVFYCIVALTLCCLLLRQLHPKGIVRSIREMLEQLGGIREVGIVYAAKREAEPTIQMTISEMSADQRALYDALDLDRYRAA